MSSTWWMALPALVIVLGGCLTFVWKPSTQSVSLVQHVAAGTILAALMLEVFPEITRNQVSRLLLLPAFAVGALAMFGLKLVGERIDHRFSGPNQKTPMVNYAGRPNASRFAWYRGRRKELGTAARRFDQHQRFRHCVELLI